MFGLNISSLQTLLKSDKSNNFLGRSDNWFRLFTTQMFLSHENII